MRTGDNRLIWLGLFAGSFALAALAQWVLAAVPQGTWPAAGLYGAAIMAFVLSTYQLGRLPVGAATTAVDVPNLRWREFPWLPAGLAIISALAWLQAVRLNLDGQGTLDAHRVGSYLWALSVVAFIAAALAYWWTPPTDIWRGIKAARWDLLIVVGLTLLAAAVRLPSLTTVPYPFQGDEASIGAEAVRILQGKVTNVFQLGWSSQPNMSFLPVALFVRILGADVAGVRASSVLQAIATVPLLYLLGRATFGRLVGLVAALFLASWHFHIHFSRLAWMNVGDAFFSTLAFLLVYRAANSRRPLDYLWAGLAASFAWYSYVGARLVFGLVALWLLYMLVRQRRFLAENWQGLLLFAATVVVVAGPQLLWFRDHPADFATRMNQVGVLQSGYLQREATRLGTSPFVVWWGLLSRSLLGFIARPAAGGFYNASIPLLDFVSAILFVLGLAYSTVKLLDPRFFMLASWFWATIIFGGALTVDLAWHRLLLAAPAVCLMIGVAVAMIADALAKGRVAPRRLGYALTALFLVGVSAYNIQYYFGEYTPRYLLADANTEIGQEMGRYLNGLGSEYVAYFAGTPRMFIGFPSIPFFAPNVRGQDMTERLTIQNVPALPAGKNAVFMSIPERRDELEVVRQRYPQGEWREFPSQYLGQPLFYAYEVRRP